MEVYTLHTFIDVISDKTVNTPHLVISGLILGVFLSLAVVTDTGINIDRGSFLAGNARTVNHFIFGVILIHT